MAVLEALGFVRGVAGKGRVALRAMIPNQGPAGAFLFQGFGKFAMDQRDRRPEGKGRVPEAVFDGVVVCLLNDVFDLHVCSVSFLHDSKSDFVRLPVLSFDFSFFQSFTM